MNCPCGCEYCKPSGIPRIKIPRSTSSERIEQLKLQLSEAINDVLRLQMSASHVDAVRQEYVIACDRLNRDCAELREANQELINQIHSLRHKFKESENYNETVKRDYIQLFNRHNEALAKLDEIKGIVN